MNKQILDGVRVLDLTNVLAGPFATLHLALLGAEVIKIERPGSGDLARKLGTLSELNEKLMGTSFLAQNANKKSMTLNTKSPEGKEIFKTLARDADVLVELRGSEGDQSGPDLLCYFRFRADRARCAQAGLRPDNPGSQRRNGRQRRRTVEPIACRVSRV
jgi:cysteine synthase